MDDVRSVFCQSADGNDPDSYAFLFRKMDDKKWANSCCQEHDCFLVDCCLVRFLKSTHNTAAESTRVYKFSRILNRLCIILREQKYAVPLSMQSEILDFVYKFWDFVMDVVAHDCVTIFTSLLGIHSNNCSGAGGNCGCEWIQEIFTTLLHSSALHRSRLRCMFALLRNFPSSSAVNMDETFIHKLYSLISNASLSVVISDLIAHDMERNLDRRNFHVVLISSGLQSPDEFNRKAIEHRLLPILFRNPSLSPWLIERFTLAEVDFSFSDGFNSFLVIAQFCLFNQKSTGNNLGWTDLLSNSVMIRALIHSKIQIRLSAWILLSDHPKTTQPFSQLELQLMKCFLVANGNEQGPAARQAILTGLKKILIRMRESGDRISRNGLENSDLVQDYSDFLDWLCRFAFKCLERGANFSRRLMGLYFIDHLVVQDYVKNEEKQSLLSPETIQKWLSGERFRILLDCLDDSYQLCQSHAYRLLTKLRFSHEMDWPIFLTDIYTSIISSQSPGSNSASYRLRFYLHNFPEQVETVWQHLVGICAERISAIESSIFLIIRSPLHSILQAISEIITEHTIGTIRIEELIPICITVAQLVAPVVHHMSPEGYLPLDDDDQVVDEAATEHGSKLSQALLVHCWRTHKQISSIFSSLIEKAEKTMPLRPVDIRKIGDYFWTQLIECKHCGAFETAVEGFEKLCSYLWRKGSEEEMLPKPGDWLEKILAAIWGNEDANLLCSTRRSAGLPFLVTAIVCTEPVEFNRKAYGYAVNSLLEFPKFEPKLQVHAINVLRALFRDRRQAECLLGIDPALQTCMVSFASDDWPVRNAATQLFAALIVRIFGVPRMVQRSLRIHPKNKLSAFEFFTRFPSVYNFLINRFASSQNLAEFAIFPQLILLSHLFPTQQQEFRLTNFIPTVFRLLMKCRSEKFRQLCVAALISIAEIEDLDTIFLTLIGNIDKKLSQNSIAGILCFVSSLAEDVDKADCPAYISALMESIINERLYKNWCSYNLRSFFHLIHVSSTRLTVDELRDFGKCINSTTLLQRNFAQMLLANADNFTEDLLPSLGEEERVNLEAEIFRACAKKNVGSEMLEWIIQLALKRLETGNLNEGTIEWIGKMLLIGLERNIYDEALLERIKQVIDTYFSKRTLVSKSPGLNKLKYAQALLTGFIDTNLVECLGELSLEEEMENRLLALEVMGKFISKAAVTVQIQLLRLTGHLLQDDCVQIREQVNYFPERHFFQTASIFSSLLSGRTDLQLAPELCWQLSADYGMEFQKKVMNDSMNEQLDDAVLFDACAKNPFAETIAIDERVLIREIQLDHVTPPPGSTVMEMHRFHLFMLLLLFFSGISFACPSNTFVPCLLQLKSQSVPVDRNPMKVVFSISSKAKLIHICKAYTEILPCVRDRIDSCGDRTQRARFDQVTRLVAFLCTPFALPRQRQLLRIDRPCIRHVLKSPVRRNCTTPHQHSLAKKLEQCRLDCPESETICQLRLRLSEQAVCTVVAMEQECGDDAVDFYIALQTALTDDEYPIQCNYALVDDDEDDEGSNSIEKLLLHAASREFNDSAELLQASVLLPQARNFLRAIDDVPLLQKENGTIQPNPNITEQLMQFLTEQLKRLQPVDESGTIEKRPAPIGTMEKSSPVGDEKRLPPENTIEKSTDVKKPTLRTRSRSYTQMFRTQKPSASGSSSKSSEYDSRKTRNYMSIADEMVAHRKKAPQKPDPEMTDQERIFEQFMTTAGLEGDNGSDPSQRLYSLLKMFFPGSNGSMTRSVSRKPVNSSNLLVNTNPVDQPAAPTKKLRIGMPDNHPLTGVKEHYGGGNWPTGATSRSSSTSSTRQTRASSRGYSESTTSIPGKWVPWYYMTKTSAMPETNLIQDNISNLTVMDPYLAQIQVPFPIISFKSHVSPPPNSFTFGTGTIGNGTAALPSGKTFAFTFGIPVAGESTPSPSPLFTRPLKILVNNKFEQSSTLSTRKPLPSTSRRPTVTVTTPRPLRPFGSTVAVNGPIVIPAYPSTQSYLQPRPPAMNNEDSSPQLSMSINNKPITLDDIAATANSYLSAAFESLAKAVEQNHNNEPKPSSGEPGEMESAIASGLSQLMQIVAPAVERVSPSVVARLRERLITGAGGETEHQLG